MEVNSMTSKALHWHTLPVLVAALIFVIVSLAGYKYYANPVTARIVQRAIVTRYMSVKPARNGLAKISVIEPTDKSKARSPQLGAIGTTTGGTTQLDLNAVPH